MSINNDTTKPGSLHALRQEFRAHRERERDIIRHRENELKELDKRIAAMRAERPTVYVEDIIIDRLYEAEANLSLAVGLYQELAEDEHSPYLPYGGKLKRALEIVRDALHLRDREGGA